MRILCFGDSNTWGYDPRDFFGGRYDSCWVDLLGSDAINGGVNGRQIPRTAPPLPTHDLLLVMLGTNDLLQGASPAEAAARMAQFLEQLLSSGEKILLIAPPPMKRGARVPTDELVADSMQLAVEYRKVAQRLNIDFVDTSGWDIGLCFDGVHFTEAGHYTFAEHLKKHLTLT